MPPGSNANEAGSIPEKEDGTNNIYNTLTAYNPEGEMVAKHRKVHLFDIDIPGRQKFKVSQPDCDWMSGEEGQNARKATVHWNGGEMGASGNSLTPFTSERPAVGHSGNPRR